MVRRRIAPESFLAAVPLFALLDAHALARIAAATARRSVGRGETLFRQGDAPTGMYIVIYGEIHLLSRTRSRGARLTGVVGPGKSFGEPVMFLDRPALVEARAASDSLLLHVPKEALFAEIERNPRFALRIIAALSQRIEGLVRELERQAIGSGRERVVDYLLRRCSDGPGPAQVVLPASKAAVASQLNLTAEHFSRILHELQEQGLVRIEGRTIGVPDRDRLAAPGKRSRLRRRAQTASASSKR